MSLSKPKKKPPKAQRGAGGKRPGAGRKRETPVGAIPRNVRMTDSEYEAVKSLLDSLRKPKESQVI